MTPSKRRASEADLGDKPRDTAVVTTQHETGAISLTGKPKDEPESEICVPTCRNVDRESSKRQVVLPVLAAEATVALAHDCIQDDVTLNNAKAESCQVDAISDSGTHSKLRRRPSKNSIERLPAAVWIRILGYSVFSDASRLAKESFFIKNTVLPLLSFVYFDSETPSYWCTSAHQFSFDRVEEILIDCLISGVSHFETFSIPGWFRIKNLAEFLSGFKNLKHVLIGKGEDETRAEVLTRLGLAGNPRDGYGCDEALSTNINHPYEPRDEFTVRLYQALLEQLSSGYEQGILPNDLYFHGLPSQHERTRRQTGFAECRGESCLFCHRICRNFPLGQVLSLNSREAYFPQQIGLVRPSTRIKWIHKRPDGGSAVLIANQEELWKALFAMNTDLVDSSGQKLIHFYDAILDAMEKLKEYGCDPGCIVIKENFPFNRSCNAIARMAYVKLRQIGFEMDEEDFAAIVPCNALYLYL